METKINDRFTMTIKSEIGDFNLSYPATATYQMAFNATLQCLLNIYDLLKEVDAAAVKKKEQEKAQEPKDGVTDGK